MHCTLLLVLHLTTQRCNRRASYRLSTRLYRDLYNKVSIGFQHINDGGSRDNWEPTPVHAPAHQMTLSASHGTRKGHRGHSHVYPMRLGPSLPAQPFTARFIQCFLVQCNPDQNHGRYSRSLQRDVEYCILTRTRPWIVVSPRLLSSLQLR